MFSRFIHIVQLLFCHMCELVHHRKVVDLFLYILSAIIFREGISGPSFPSNTRDWRLFHKVCSYLSCFSCHGRFPVAVFAPLKYTPHRPRGNLRRISDLEYPPHPLSRTNTSLKTWADKGSSSSSAFVSREPTVRYEISRIECQLLVVPR